MPLGIRSWFERRRALRQLQEMNRLEAEALTLSDRSPMNRAKVALEIGDKEEALRCWIEARERYPDMVLRSRDSLNILLGLTLYDEAEALMQRGRKQWPKEVHYAEGFAEVATRRNDIQVSVDRWKSVLRKFPTHWRGHAAAGGALIRAGRLEEAEALLKKAIARFPGEIACHIEYARCAEAKKDWAQVLQRWDLIAKEFKHPIGIVGAAKALMELGRPAEADAILTDARARYPINEEIATLWARASAHLGDAEELQRWQIILAKFPLVRSAYTEGSRRLNARGMVTDADQVLLAAIERFPDEAWPRLEHASLATERRDWEEAVARWNAVRTAWPDRSDGYLRGAAALEELGQRDAASALREEWAKRAT